MTNQNKPQSHKIKLLSPVLPFVLRQQLFYAKAAFFLVCFCWSYADVIRLTNNYIGIQVNNKINILCIFEVVS